VKRIKFLGFEEDMSKQDKGGQKRARTPLEFAYVPEILIGFIPSH
jgi:hypothetical protein